MPCSLSRFTIFAALAGASLGFVGCSPKSELYPGKTEDQVWTAMVAAAENPTYPDWHVIENDAWADDGSRRIEIYRLLRRYRDPAGQWARLEDREWTFVAILEPTDPPSVTFKARGWHIPSHAWPEEERYFQQVWEFLGGKPAPGELELMSASPSDARSPAVESPSTVSTERPATQPTPGSTDEQGSSRPVPPVDLPD